MKLLALLPIAALIVIPLAFAFLTTRAKRRRVDGADGELEGVVYERATFVSPAERSFIGVLDQAIGSQYRVFGKVRVADVLSVSRDTDPAKRRSAFNRISAKHFDFIVCAPDDLQVLCAIELNDTSHAQARRRERDDFVAEACKQAQLPLLMLPAKHAYSIDEVRHLVLTTLGVPILPPRTSPRPIETPAQDVVTAEPVQASPAPQIGPEPMASVAPQVSEHPEAEAVAVPACPKCGEPMVKRTGKTGTYAGKAFWGCTRFPACRGMQSA
ncbi:DUF2726 domain-containing protein [Aromatoleum evansii]|uniref:DUF2726 domain-containing protein n=1 Tax=Aromatoleum evansii TaxID=59406 RepID=UPI00145CA9FF|nr:DUF2726 domain-containing protein [Aromatoleum evansii]NMG30584.1 DUF2726 domain-containing protein [Aromatoleum evansii]